MSDLSITSPAEALSMLPQFFGQTRIQGKSIEDFAALAKAKGFALPEVDADGGGMIALEKLREFIDLNRDEANAFPLPDADADGDTMTAIKTFQDLAGDKLAQAKQLAESAKQMEAVFVQKLVDTMKNTIGESGLFTDSGAKQINGMFWQFLSDDISSKSSMGLAKPLYEDFCRMNDIDDAPEFSKLETLQ